MMEKAKPILKTLILGLTSLVAILGLILIPLMTCTKPAQAAGTDSYLLLEYIETSGSQYINTGFIPSTNTKWVMDWEITTLDSTTRGNGAQSTNGRYDIYISNANTMAVVSGGANAKSLGSASLSRYTSIIDCIGAFACYNEASSTVTVGSIPTTSVYIGAINNGGTSAAYTYAKYYSSQIYDNGVLVRDFVPVKRSSDGSLGFLDRVNNVFYGNSGTGTFSAGYLSNDLYVSDYLQSSGSQYIDTGFVGSSMGTAIVTAEVVAAGNSNTFIGGSFAGGTTRFYLWRLTSAGVSQFVGWGSDVSLSNGSSINNKTTGVIDGLTLKANLNDTFINLTSVSFDASLSFYLFKLHRVTNQDQDNSIAKIYSATLFENGALKRNMIPVYDPNNNVAGMWDNANNVFYGNSGTGSFGYQLSGGGTIYQVNTENALNSALTSSVAGDLIVLTGNVTTSSQTVIVGNAPVYFSIGSLSSSYHPNSALYSVEGWYTSQWSGKVTNGKMEPSTTYIARFQADVNSATAWGLVLGNSLSGDIINITGGFTYTTSSFTIPANVTVNKNGNTILPPANTPMTQIGYNSNASATTDASSFVANTTYYAIYIVPNYVVRLIIDPEVTIDMTGFTATTTEYASYTSIEFPYTYGNAVQIPIPTWDLHSFNGWWLNGTVGPYSGISSTDYGDKVFYAKWVEAPAITIGNVNIFRNLINNGDRLIMFTSNIDWENLPANNVRTMFMFRLMDSDGSTVLATTQPYYAYNGGYYLQAVGFYFPDDSVIEWGGEYQIRIDGNPSQWYTISDVKEIYNITGVDYTEASDQSANQTELAAWIINISQLLENDWLNYLSIAPLITTDSNGNQVLTKTGQSYYLNTLANINYMAPSLFGSTAELTPIIPDNPMPETPASPSLIERWENQYEGTWVQESLQAFGDLFHTNWRTITSILCLVLWVIFAAISQMKWGTTDAGLWMGSVMFGVMVTMGLMNWAIVITAAILMALYSLYIVFWRQG